MDNITSLNNLPNKSRRFNRIFTLLMMFVLMLVMVISPKASVKAEELEEVYVYVFAQDGCPKCSSLKIYLSEYIKENKHVKLKIFDGSNIRESENHKINNKVREVYKIETTDYPLTVIGGKFVIGYSANREKEIEEYIEYYQSKKHVNVVNKILLGDEIDEDWIETDKVFNLPLIGEVKAKEANLFLVSILIGFADGINPCGMWVLLFIISMLIPSRDKKKIWILGGAFILTSGIFYFLMMMGWTALVNTFAGNKIFLIISGLIALAAGGWNLYKYIKAKVNKEEGCDVTSADQKRKISKKVKTLINEKNIWIAVVGVVGVTLLINLFELACSAGWPYIFTTILAENKLTFAGELFYILIYIIFFLIDDIIIFTVAILTLRIKAVSNKLSKYAHLIGGILMLIFGILMIFFPDILR